MTAKVIYFTAGNKATTEELADIAELTSQCGKAFELQVRNGSISTDSGAGIEDADYVAGTIPTAYNAYDEFDIDTPPIPVSIEATDALVANGGTVVVKNSAGSVSKNGTATVAANAITGVALAATEAIVTNGAVKTGVTGSGTTATITVANGVISAIALS